jgi:hypothetical protein
MEEMTMHMHDPQMHAATRIENELEVERNRLAKALEALQDRISPVTLLQENLHLPVEAIDRAVRRNPMAVALAGAGIAWLLLGRKGEPAEAKAEKLMLKRDELVRWEDEGGPPPPEADDQDDWMDEAEALRQRALASLGRLDNAARSRLASVEEVARAKGRVLADLADDLKGAMGRGLSGLTEAAQSKILAAREKAWEARVAAGESASASIERHPYVSGLIALAAGAAVGAAFAPTEAENRYLGPERDRLLGMARQALADEKARAVRAVHVALHDDVAQTAQQAVTHGETSPKAGQPVF